MATRTPDSSRSERNHSYVTLLTDKLCFLTHTTHPIAGLANLSSDSYYTKQSIPASNYLMYAISIMSRVDRMYLASFAAEHCDVSKAWALISREIQLGGSIQLDFSQLVGTPLGLDSSA